MAANPKAAFYLPHPRALELGVGALLAFLPASRWHVVSEIMGVAGLALIGWSAFTLIGTEASPGWPMVPAVLGSALLVWPRSESWTARLLAIKPMRVAGLISYNLYLWHWPVLVFYRLTHVEQTPSVETKTWLISLTFALAALSFWFVERPMRSRSVTHAVRMTIPAAAIIATCGVAIKCMDGVASRLPEAAINLANGAKDYSQRRPTCHRTFEFNPPLNQSCLLGDKNSSPHIAIWGDSHSVEIGDALGELEGKHNRSIVMITYSSCPAAQNFVSSLQQGCPDFSKQALKFLLDRTDLTTIIVSVYYQLYLNSPSNEKFKVGFQQSMRALAEAGKRIFIVASIPEAGYSIPPAAAQLAMMTSSPTIEVPIETHRDFSAEAREMIDRLASTYPKVEIIDPANVLCDARNCHLIIDGHAVLFDADHLTMFAARRVAPEFTRYLANLSSTVRQ